MSADVVLARLERTLTEELRVTLRYYLGRPFVDVRIFFLNEEGAWCPTRRGVSVRIGQLAEVSEALDRALDELGGKRGRAA